MNYITYICCIVVGLSVAEPLQLDVYNPQQNGISPVSSTLISGPKEAILVDAQFSTKDGDKLVEMIRMSKKHLKEIIITSGDPDFYFGLEPIVKAFPDTKVSAAAHIVDHIVATKDEKLKYWTPYLKDGAPKKIIVPQSTNATSFSVDGATIELHNPDRYMSYLRIPKKNAIIGGTGIAFGIHVWTADTQTTQSRLEWRSDLNKLLKLKPKIVTPGHYIGTLPERDRAITFTIEYLRDFEKALSAHKHSDGVIKAMKTLYPNLAMEKFLEIGAKVNKGEIKW